MLTVKQMRKVAGLITLTILLPNCASRLAATKSTEPDEWKKVLLDCKPVPDDPLAYICPKETLKRAREIMVDQHWDIVECKRDVKMGIEGCKIRVDRYRAELASPLRNPWVTIPSTALIAFIVGLVLGK